MEILLLLFIYSGLLKGYLLFLGTSFPIDVTVFTLILIFVKFGFDSIIKKKTIVFSKSYENSIFLLVLFYLWIIFTLIYTPSIHYSFQKAGFFGLNFIAFSLPLLHGNVNVKKFIKGFIIISISCGLAYLPFQFLYQLGEMSLTPIDQLDSVSGMYLQIGEYLGLSLVLCVTSKRLWKSNLIQYLIGWTCFIILILIGARGPLIFVVIIVIFTLIININLKFNFIFSIDSYIKIVIVSILVFVIYSYNSQYIDVLFERTFSRFMVLSENDSSNKSAIARIEFLEVSFHHIFKNPIVFLFGNGIGSFGILVFNEDIRAYPHNIFLEIFFELGFLGILIFFFWIFFSIKNMKGKNQFISILVLIYLCMNFLKSSSIIDIRLFFIIFAFYISDNKINSNSNENITYIS